MQKYIFDFEQVIHLLPDILVLEKTRTNRNFNKTFIVYLLSVSKLDKQSILKLVDKMEVTLKSEIMTTYDQLIAEGEKKGIEKGKEETKIQTILKGFAAKVDIELLADICDYTQDEVISILKEHGKL